MVSNKTISADIFKIKNIKIVGKEKIDTTSSKIPLTIKTGIINSGKIIPS